MTTPTLSRNGKYLRWENLQGHPLADARGRVPAHRLALWDAMAQPSHSACWICGFVLPWKVPEGLFGRSTFMHVVNVDHIDEDTTNNDANNLAPACWWCNANRGWAMELVPDDFKALVKILGTTTPAARPQVSAWCEARYGLKVDATERCWIDPVKPRATLGETRGTQPTPDDDWDLF